MTYLQYPCHYCKKKEGVVMICNAWVCKLQKCQMLAATKDHSKCTHEPWEFKP